MPFHLGYIVNYPGRERHVDNAGFFSDREELIIAIDEVIVKTPLATSFVFNVVPNAVEYLDG